MPDLQFLEPASFGPSTLPFSQGVRAGNLLFIAGQGAVDDEGNFVGKGDIREQTRVTLDRVRRVCEEAGGDLSNVVTATVFLTDLGELRGLQRGVGGGVRRPPPGARDRPGRPALRHARRGAGDRGVD